MTKFMAFFLLSICCSASFAQQTFVVAKEFSIPAGKTFFKLSTYKGQEGSVNYEIDCFFISKARPNTLVTEKGDKFEVVSSSEVNGADLTPEEKIAVQIGFEDRPLNFIYPLSISYCC